MNAGNLSQSDTLRLNMLLTQPVQAVRIDESKMIVYALSPRGEMSVRLNPDCRDDVYLRRVRELLSSHYLGSPGGYPVFLRRWTRMGQARAGSLEKLLLLGEEEAAVAVVHAPDLDAELARRVWWAYPDAENARRMLERQAVACSDLGAELARYLFEYLPFETSHLAMIDSIRLMLQPGLLEPVSVDRLWRQAQRRNTYLVGFLRAGPERLPGADVAAHAEYPALLALGDARSRLAERLLWVLSGPGQAFLRTIAQVLRRPADQDVVVALFEVIDAAFAPLRQARASCRSAGELQAAAAAGLAQARTAGDPVALDFAALSEALLVLANCGEQLVAPILGRTDAVGTVLRKQLTPVTDAVWSAIERLSGEQPGGGGRGSR